MHLRKHSCVTDTTVCPDLVPAAVYGRPDSIVTRTNVRRWFFVLESERDAFMQAVEAGEFRRGQTEETD